MEHQLNELERAIFDKIANAYIEKFPFLAEHLPHLKVASRKNTGVGVTTNFEYTAEGENLIDRDAGDGLLSLPEIVMVPKVKKGLSFVLDITGGQIEYLEIFTEDEKWNGEAPQFRFEDKIVP